MSAVLGSISISERTGTDASDPMMLSCLQMKSFPANVAPDLRKAINRCSIARVPDAEPCAVATICDRASNGWRLVSDCHLAAWASKESRFAFCAGAIGDQSDTAITMTIAIFINATGSASDATAIGWLPHH